jgi:hypothetical protein
MWHILHLIARPIEALLGVFCILTAILLYPNQEGAIQSKLEDFWVRVDDFKNLTLSRHAAFMTQVAKLETRFLDAIFGQKLMSGQALGVSFCLANVVWYLRSISLDFELSGSYGKSDMLKALALNAIYLVFSLAVGAASVFVRTRKNLRRAIISISIVVIFSLSLINDESGYIRAMDAIETTVGLVGGFGCDVVFIILTRKLVRLAGEMTSALRVAATVSLNLVLALFLVSPLFLFRSQDATYGWNELSEVTITTLVLIGLSNVVDALLALLFVVLAAMLLIHRAVWPLLARTLFRMADIGTKGRRAILTAVGLALLSASVFGGKFPELLKDLTKIFGG